MRHQRAAWASWEIPEIGGRGVPPSEVKKEGGKHATYIALLVAGVEEGSWWHCARRGK